MQKIKEKILEDEAITRNVKNAADFQYMKSLRFHLKVLNAWPGDDIEGNQPKKKIFINIFMFMVNLSCVSSSMHYTMAHWDTLPFFELGHMYIVSLIIVASLARILLTLPHSTKYMNVGELFLTKIHLIYFKDVSEYAMKTYKQINVISRLFTLVVIGQVLGGLVLFNFTPIWNNYSQGKFEERKLNSTTYELSFYLSVPVLKIYTHFDAYVLACLFLGFVSYTSSMIACIVDLFLSLMIFNLWGHLKILLHDLASFPLPAKEVISSMDDRYASVTAEMYSKEELKLISHKLIQCIDYHRLIANFNNKITEAFGPILLICFVFYQVSGCLLLLECSQGTAEALIRYLPVSFVIFQQLIQLSIVFELIGSTVNRLKISASKLSCLIPTEQTLQVKEKLSEKLKDAVYGVPWQYMDTKNRKIVAIFMYNVQEPIHVQAMGVINVGVNTMASILKTTLSYFTFLRSM